MTGGALVTSQGPPMCEVALESPLLRGAGFRHGFSTKRLDFRPPSVASLESLCLVLRIHPGTVYQASQVHGAVALLAEGGPAGMLENEADALVGTKPGTAVAVRVADCVPVLLADPKTGAVAAVHAGWRGLTAGVIENAIDLARERGVTLTLAAVGPCIGSCCFEVGKDVAERIAAASSPSAITRTQGDKAFVDLRAAVHAKLARQGIEGARVDDVSGCTKCGADRFFSHRRQGEAAGRHLAVIACR